MVTKLSLPKVPIALQNMYIYLSKKTPNQEEEIITICANYAWTGFSNAKYAIIVYHANSNCLGKYSVQWR